MKRLFILLVVLVTLPLSGSASWFHSVEYDYKTAAMMEETYLAEFAAEGLNLASIQEFLKHYESAEIATVGIFASKYLDRQAMKDAGLLSTQENYYYHHIYFLVQQRIIPRLIIIGRDLIANHPSKALYWGPVLMKVCDEIQSLCKIFELVVTNGKLSFSDINFIEICPELRQFFDLAKLGDVDWQQLFNDLTDFPKNYTKDDLLSDFRQMFTGVTMAGSDIITNNAESIIDGLAEKPEKIQDIFTGFNDTFSSITNGSAVKDFLKGVVGELKDSLAVTRMFQGSNYNITEFISSYLDNFGGKYYTQRWYIYNTYYGYQKVVYEEVFDSKLMDLNSFSSQMELRRKDYEQNDELNEYYSWWKPVRYYIGKDSKKEYTVENENTVRGASTASFHLKCDNTLELAKSSFSFKINPRYDSSKLHEYALPPGSIDPPRKPDVSEWEDKISEYDRKIAVIDDQIESDNSQIRILQIELNNLQFQIDTCTNAEIKRSLQTEYQVKQYDIYDLQDSIKALEKEKQRLQQEIAPYKDAYNELEEDYNEELDGPYRINTAMDEAAKIIGIVWDDTGHWEGDTYVRNGHVTSGGEAVQFRAEVSEKRGEKRFLGIRYHRAIVGVEWKIVSDLSSSSVVDVMTIDTSLSDQEIANMVNQRMNEIRAENPGCQVTVSYGYKTPPEQDSPEEAYHLLWVSDRVAIAREVDQRLVNINSRLVLLQKWLYEQYFVSESLWWIVRTQVRRTKSFSVYDHAFNRWLDVASGGGVKTIQ